MKSPLKFILPICIYLFACEANSGKTGNMRSNLENAILDSIRLDSLEKEKLHLQNIEVGKSKYRIEFSKGLQSERELLKLEKDKFNEINQFEFGRLSSTKTSQLERQRSVIKKIEDRIDRLEFEIPLLEEHKTFDFQDSPLSLVEKLFQFAGDKEYKFLRHLCDPYGESSESAIVICFLGIQDLETRNLYFEQLKNGRVMGQKKLEKNKVEIEVAVGVNSDRLQKIELIQRGDKWYFLRF